MHFLVNTPTGYLAKAVLFGDWTVTTRHHDAYGFSTVDEAHQIGADVVRSDFIIVRTIGGILEEVAHVIVAASIADAVACLDRSAFERLASEVLLEGLLTADDMADVRPLRDVITDPTWRPWLTAALTRERVEIRTPL